MGYQKGGKMFCLSHELERGGGICCRSHPRMGCSLSCEHIIWGSVQCGWRSIKVEWEKKFCVGRQPSATSLDALYFKSSLKWPLLAHCNGFHHVGYERILVLSCFQFHSFQFLALCIEIEVLFQFCFNPLGLSNLITSSQVWCMISFASRASTWFHWSNSRSSPIPMFIRNVRTNQGRRGTI
jgi:hypothetical protein